MVAKIRDGFMLAAVTSAVTVVAGLLHLGIAYEVIGVSTLAATIFVIFGIPQLVWVIPTIRQWGIKWYAAGIAWNGALTGFFVMTLLPNPVTVNPVPPVAADIIIEILQIAFIGLSMAMIIRERKRKYLKEEEKRGLV